MASVWNLVVCVGVSMESLDSLINRSHVIDSDYSGRRPVREEVFIKLPDRVHKPTGEFTTLEELMSKEYPDNSWIVERLVPEGLTILSAQPASFKTWLLLDIAIAVASGGALIDTFDTTQSSVLMIDEESSEKLLQQRLGLLNSGSDLPIYFKVCTDFKLDDAHISDVIKRCKKDNIKLITFDSLVRIHDKNENDAVQMAEVFAKIRRFTQAGISVLIAHHNRKGGRGDNPSQEIRGSSDILAAVDCHLSLMMKRDIGRKVLQISQTKVRFSEELEPFELEVVVSDDSVGFKYSGVSDHAESKRDKLAGLILEILSDGKVLNQKDILMALEGSGNKANAKTVRAVLQILTAAQKLATTSGKGSELLYKRS